MSGWWIGIEEGGNEGREGNKTTGRQKQGGKEVIQRWREDGKEG